MRGKPIRYKNKILVALVALFTMLMCTSVGFASWITAGGGSGSINGNIEADDYTASSSGEYAYCITDLEVDPFRYSTSYGFVDENTGMYVSTINLTGSFIFDVSEAKTAISSLNSTSKQFSIKIDFSTTYTTNLSVGTIALNGFSTCVGFNSNGNSSPASKTFNITLNNTEYSSASIECSFAIPITYSGTFPNLASQSYSVVITPDEVAA